MKSIIPAIVLIAAATALPVAANAIELNPFSIVKGAVEAVVEDRSSDDIAKDAKIKATITVDVIEAMGTGSISISADVYEQNVMLSGVVETKAERMQAEKLTRAVKGVRRIYNEILIKSALEAEKGAVEGFVDDTVIETKINALLLDAKGVNVTNFRWRSVGGRIFLFGRALSKDELAKAIRVIKGIKGVRSVKDNTKVRG